MFEEWGAWMSLRLVSIVVCEQSGSIDVVRQRSWWAVVREQMDSIRAVKVQEIEKCRVMCDAGESKS